MDSNTQIDNHIDTQIDRQIDRKIDRFNIQTIVVNKSFAILILDRQINTQVQLERQIDR